MLLQRRLQQALNRFHAYLAVPMPVFGRCASRGATLLLHVSSSQQVHAA